MFSVVTDVIVPRNGGASGMLISIFCPISLLICSGIKLIGIDVIKSFFGPNASL